MEKSSFIENRIDDDPYGSSISSLTLGGLIHKKASECPDHLAVIDYMHHRRLTYLELDELSDALAKGLIHLGLTQGDHVAVIINNCWEHVVTKLAISKAGGVLVNVNIHEKADMLRKLLENTECSMIIVKQGIKNRDHMDMLYELCPEIKLQRPDSLHTEFLPKLRQYYRDKQCNAGGMRLEAGYSSGGRKKTARPLAERTVGNHRYGSGCLDHSYLWLKWHTEGGTIDTSSDDAQCIRTCTPYENDIRGSFMHYGTFVSLTWLHRKHAFNTCGGCDDDPV